MLSDLAGDFSSGLRNVSLESELCHPSSCCLAPSSSSHRPVRASHNNCIHLLPHSSSSCRHEAANQTSHVSPLAVLSPHKACSVPRTQTQAGQRVQHETSPGEPQELQSCSPHLSAAAPGSYTSAAARLWIPGHSGLGRHCS